MILILLLVFVLLALLFMFFLPEIKYPWEEKFTIAPPLAQNSNYPKNFHGTPELLPLKHDSTPPECKTDRWCLPSAIDASFVTCRLKKCR